MRVTTWAARQALLRNVSVVGLIALSAILHLVTPLPSDAQPAKVPTIGVLAPSGGRNPIDIAFEQSLQQRGWVRNQNIRIETRYSAGRPEAFPSLAAEIAGLGADVFVAWTAPAAIAAKRAAGSAPVVFLAVGDPVASGLVSSLARPGGNVTGVSFDASPETYAKRLELLKEAVPTLARVALLISPGTSWSAYARTMAEARQALKLEIIEIAMQGDADAAVRLAKQQGAQALYVVTPNPFAWGAHLSSLAITHRLPSMHHFRENATAGGLLSYAPSLTHIAGRGALYVDRILKGGKPADLPVEQPTKFDLVINVKTAKALGLNMPPSLLLRADTIIE
jgi:putative ABC transport system substrate-binding protein